MKHQLCLVMELKKCCGHLQIKIPLSGCRLMDCFFFEACHTHKFRENLCSIFWITLLNRHTTRKEGIRLTNASMILWCTEDNDSPLLHVVKLFGFAFEIYKITSKLHMYHRKVTCVLGIASYVCRLIQCH